MCEGRNTPKQLILSASLLFLSQGRKGEINILLPEKERSFTDNPFPG